MRKSLATLLCAVTVAFGSPIVGIAQAPTSSLRGQIVDAGGRGATGMRVELVSDRMVVATTISSADGHFDFAGVLAGNYVVRTTVNGQPTGVRVSVAAGQSAATALLVLPSMAAASPGVIMVALGPALGSIVAATVTVVGNTIVIEASKTEDAVIVQQAVVAAQQYIQTLNTQIAVQNPGTVVTPIFTFIPTNPVTPASGSQ